MAAQTVSYEESQTPSNSQDRFPAYPMLIDFAERYGAVPILIELKVGNQEESHNSDEGPFVSEVAIQQAQEQVLEQLAPYRPFKAKQFSFIPSEKYKIMSKYKDYRKQIAKELLYRYAAIVAEFKISGEMEESWFGEKLPPKKKLAVEIKHFCSEFSNRNKISWQSCVGAVVWFIGISQPAGD